MQIIQQRQHNMNIIAPVFKVTLISLGAVLTYAFGVNPTAVLILTAVIGIDYFTGLLVAISSKKVNSQIGLRGIYKKVGMLLLVSTAHLTDRILGLNNIAMSLSVIFLFANEGISVLENLGRLGIPIPSKLTNILEQLRDSEQE